MIAPLERKHLAVLATLAVLALVAGLVCARGGDGGLSDAAAQLVPASALVYVHLGTDPEREPDARLARIAGSLPFVERLRDRIVAAVSPQAFDLERDVRPWLGDEIAYAAVSPTDSVVLAAVADRPKAEALVARIGNLSAAERYRGVRVLVAGPTALAFVGGFLAVGTEAAVHAAVDRDHGDGERLADLPAYERASAGLPPERSVDAYASAAGVRAVLAPRDGLLGALGALLDRPGLTAVGASVTAEEPRPARARATRGRRSARRRVRARAARARAGERRRVRGRARRAGARRACWGGWALSGRSSSSGRRSPAGLASGSSATCSSRSPASSRSRSRETGEDPGGTGGATPVVTLKARTADERRTEAALARLQEPLARRLALPGTVPACAPEPIGGTGRLHAALDARAGAVLLGR